MTRRIALAEGLADAGPFLFGEPSLAAARALTRATWVVDDVGAALGDAEAAVAACSDPDTDAYLQVGVTLGELLYLTVGVPDSQAFRDFYGAVFGWTFSPGRVPDGWRVAGVTPMMGMHGGARRPAVVPMFGVPDIDAAVRAVRAAGGTATDPARQSYGTTADCVDDQGTRFYLGQA